MSYITRGTIQVRKKSSLVTALITPNQDYRVKHRDEEYTVLLTENGDKALARIVDKEYTFEDKVEGILVGILVEAASRSIAVEVEIEHVPGKSSGSDVYKIVAVTMPATVTKQS